MNRPFAAGSITEVLAAREPFRLGNATIDPMSREGRWGGGTERLQPQTLKVLLALAARRGEVVTRDELVELCWDGRIVGDDVINRSISLLRHFAERAGGFAIETVPRCGYRLVEYGRSRVATRQRTALAGAGIVLVAAAVMILMQRPLPPQPPMLSVAVESFASDGGDENSRRLAGQIEDASIRMLTESGISVSRAHQARQARSQPDFILSGSVSGSGKQAVATIRLDDPLRHAIVLSRQIHADAGDPSALPDQVGAQLSASLSPAAPLLRLDRTNPSDPALVANLLNTNQSDFDSQRVFELARRTAPSAPNSAIAQWMLATSTGMNLAETPPAERAQALAMGRAAAERTLHLAPKLGNSYVPWCLLHAEVRIAECEARLRDGLSVDPRASAAGFILGHLLHNVGRIEEAVPVARQGLAKDAYGPSKIAALLILLETRGQSEEAKSLFARGKRLWPRYHGLFWNRMAGILARGNWQGVDTLEKEVGSEALPPGYQPLSPLARAVTSNSPSQVRALCPSKADVGKAIPCMLALAQVNDLNGAYRLSDRLFSRRTAGTAAEEEAIWLSEGGNLDSLFLTGPGAATMRRDPRFFALAERLGLVRYWRSNRLPDFCARSDEPVCRQIAGR